MSFTTNTTDIKKAVINLETGYFNKIACGGIYYVLNPNPHTTDNFRRCDVNGNFSENWTKEDIEKDLEGYEITCYGERA